VNGHTRSRRSSSAPTGRLRVELRYDGRVVRRSRSELQATLNFQIRRDWAALGGGVGDHSTDRTTPFGCGPNGAIDQSLGSGWGSDTSNGTNNGLVTPKSITIKLPTAVDISEIQVDPSNTCGDPGSSATHHYTVETSTDGTTFTLVNEGHFYAANRGHLNTVTSAGGGADVERRLAPFHDDQPDGSRQRRRMPTRRRWRQRRSDPVRTGHPGGFGVARSWICPKSSVWRSTQPSIFL
jgi:hypothetical protein